MLRIIFITLLLSTLSVAAQTTAEPSKEYFDIVGKADKAIADNKWDEASELITKAMRLEPGNPTNILLLSNLGMVQYFSGADSLALATLTSAHKQAPQSVTVLQNRARVLTSVGRLDDALRDYATIIRLDTTIVEPRFYHSMLSFQLGDVATAMADAEYMQSHFPEHESTILAMATIKAFTGKYNEAIPLLSKLIESKPTAADYSTRAMCYLMTSQLQEASDDIQKGLELDPVDGELYLYRALLNKMRYRPDDAKADAEKARLYGVSSQRLKALDL